MRVSRASVRQHRDTLGKRMDGVEEATNEVAEALRTQVLNGATRAQEARETRTDDLQKRLDENLSALRSQKTDYQTLAALLGDMAARLSEGDGEADTPIPPITASRTTPEGERP